MSITWWNIPSEKIQKKINVAIGRRFDSKKSKNNPHAKLDLQSACGCDFE